MFSIQVDSQGRMLVPDGARAEMGIEDGERFILKTDPANGTLTLIRVTNPLDRLALEAITEYEASETISLADAARELGLTIDRE